MISQNKLFVFLSEHTLWLRRGQQQLCLKPSPRPLEVNKIVEECSKWSAPKVTVFLEFPWILTFFESTIPLSDSEFEAYAQMRLGFPENQQNPETVQESSTTKKALPVGCYHSVQKSSDQVGCFSAMLSEKTLELKEKLSLKMNATIELVPLIMGAMPHLLSQNCNSLYFNGLEQNYVLHKEEKILKSVVELPRLGKQAQKQFVEDHFGIEDSTFLIRLFPKPIPNKGNQIPVKPDSEQVIPIDQQQQIITVEEMIQNWKGIAKSPQLGFWWLDPENKRSLSKQWVYGAILAALLLLASAGLGFHVWSVFQEGKRLTQQVLQLENEFEIILKDTEKESLQKRQSHLENWEALSRKLVEQAFWKKQLIQKVFKSLEGAWLERFLLSDQTLRMELLALKSINTVDVYLRLSKIRDFEHVHFKSLENISLKNQKVIRFTLIIQLKQPQSNLK